MLAQRLSAAAVGIPVILAVILLGGAVYTFVTAAIVVLATLEFNAIAVPSGNADETRSPWRPSVPAVAAAGGAGLIVVGADAGFDEWTGTLVAALGLVSIATLAVYDRERAFPDWLAAAGALIYVGFLGSFLVILRGLPGGTEWVLLAVVSTWGTDTFAYFTGKLVGRTRMAPHISPGKTWEGTAGALVGGLATVVLLNAVLDLPMSVGEAALLGLLLPPVSVVADLGESMIKRGAGVKDTSELIPGHGGFLDRMDSILFTVPLVYYFAIWVVV